MAAALLLLPRQARGEAAAVAAAARPTWMRVSRLGAPSMRGAGGGGAGGGGGEEPGEWAGLFSRAGEGEAEERHEDQRSIISEGQ